MVYTAMDNISLKALAIVVTLLAALLGSYIPLWYERHQKEQIILTHGYIFAKGIFLGTALLHLFPSAITQFSEHYPRLEYPVIGLVVVVTIFALHIIERMAAQLLGKMAAFSNNVTIYLLILLLSIHSIFEGAALGIGDSITEIFIILIAVLAHKSSAAFALVVNMQRHGLKASLVQPVIWLFACMTPLGVLMGSVIKHVLTASNGQITLSIIDAIAAGTFIYIACLEQEDMPALPDAQKSSPVVNVMSFGLGLGLMAVVAIWM